MTYDMFLLICVLLAGSYMAWSIGANDVANAMGTSVGSGALTLKKAVLIAAVLEFSGAFFFGEHVSETIQSGIVDLSLFSGDSIIVVYGMLAALLATGLWLQIASYKGWPVSTTHSIVGSIVGFGIVQGGAEAINWENVTFIGTSWVVSPLAGGLISYGIFNLLRIKIFYRKNPVEKTKKILPYLTFSMVLFLSFIVFNHGSNETESVNRFFQSLLLGLVLGGIGAVLARAAMARIPVPKKSKSQKYHPEVVTQLEKARKQLSQIEEMTTGPIHYEVFEILGKVDALAQSITSRQEEGQEQAEFALVERIFGYLQIMSACLMAFAHGANDVANAIGPLSAAVSVLTTGSIPLHSSVPGWALALGGGGVVLGLATWGWRVIETVGKKITELTPTRGFSAEFGAALTILVASRLGMPISTTHTLVGSVIGVGLARGIEALDLRTTRYIVISWLVTVPAGAILTTVLFSVLKLFV